MSKIGKILIAVALVAVVVAEVALVLFALGLKESYTSIHYPYFRSHPAAAHPAAYFFDNFLGLN